MLTTPRRRARRSVAAVATVILALCATLLTGSPSPAAPAEPGVAPASAQAAQAARQMENLGRGVVAVRAGGSRVLVSWRLLGLDPDGIGFNVYRSTAGGAAVKLNSAVLTGGTNYVDTTADLTRANSYHVRPVVGGAEQAPSDAFTLTGNHAQEPVVRVPLRDGGPVKFVWVGDLDGDGAYDYVLDRQTSPQRLEAYRSDGQFLWQVNMGHNSTNQNNIEGGSSTINVGHNDGVTVHDLDSDGRAEVALRIANGVTFGDGETFSHSNDNHQFIAILDGRTGALRASAQVPTDYLSDGPMYARFGVGYLNGTTPSLVAYLKNRVGNGGFNLMMTAWNFDGREVGMQWKWLRGNQNAPDGHNTRIIDVDGDGKDEIAEIGFVLNGDGTLRYSLGQQDIVHGDRFHIADMDPARPGLEGYGVQQDNPNGLREYYYDADTGRIIWRHTASGTADVGRGMVGDVDPRFPGMEVWSFSGLYNAPTNRLTEPDTSLRPWPQLGLWWDGDITMELLNDGKIEKWDPQNPTPTSRLPRLVSTWNYGAVTAAQGGPTLVGDLFGDWREEAVYTNADYNELIIFTTDQPTDTRLYTLAHNPAYRNAMTFKGYMQSHHVDYFLGHGMAQPPRPSISYAGGGSGDDTQAPTAPGTPRTGQVSATSVTLSWAQATDNVGVAGYDVVRVAGDTETVVASSTAGQVTVRGLSAGTGYTFAVYARDAAGNRSERSGTVTVITGPDTPGGTCSVAYRSVGDWGSGFQGEISVRNTGTTALDGWTLGFSFANGQTIDNMWGGTPTQNGGTVSVTPASYTRTIPAGGTITLGFTASRGTTNTAPTAFTLDGTTCATA